MKYTQYSVIRLKQIKKQFEGRELSFGKRAPKVGDVATIVEVYENPKLGYELECTDKYGFTEWLVSFSPEEADWELAD